VINFIIKSIHDEMATSRNADTTLLMSFGGLIVVFLTFLKNKRKNNTYPAAIRIGASY